MKTDKYIKKDIRQSSGFFFKKGILIADFYNADNHYKGTYPIDKDFEAHTHVKKLDYAE